MPGNHDDIKKNNDKFLKESKVSFFKFQEEESPLEIAGIQEHHNPLDIPFGKEQPTQEKNMNVKDVGGPDDVDEGGMGSGRNPEGGGSAGSTAGPLISFGLNETIAKQLMDAKIKEQCPCHKKN